MSHDNRARITVEQPGKPRLYQPGNLAGWEIIGTVTRGESDTGALVRHLSTGTYAQANAGAIRSLDQRKIRAALGISNNAGRPPLPESERAKLRSIRLTDEHWDKLQRLGMGWLRRQIERAKE